jgi:hypothetical protein
MWLIPLIGSLGAVGAAIAAWRSAKATRKTVLAQIVIQITSVYGSEEMGESIKRLHAFKHKYKEGSDDIFSELLNRPEKEMRTYAKQLDGDRRRVSHYFHQIKSLLDCRVVDENFVKKLIKSDQVDTLLDVVEPLEKAKKTDYDHSTFDTFRRIYHKESQREAKPLLYNQFPLP